MLFDLKQLVAVNGNLLHPNRSNGSEKNDPHHPAMNHEGERKPSGYVVGGQTQGVDRYGERILSSSTGKDDASGRVIKKQK